MTATIIHSADSVVMVQSPTLRRNAEIVALVQRARGGTWQLPHVWKNTVNGVETVTANPKMNERGWVWLVVRS